MFPDFLLIFLTSLSIVELVDPTELVLVDGNIRQKRNYILMFVVYFKSSKNGKIYN